MVRRLSTAILACGLAAPALFAIAAPASAQETPPAVASNRCTGVLCDLYYSNKPVPAQGQPDVPDPTHLPCHDFLCGAFGGRTADAPPPAAEPVAAAPQPAEPVKAGKHKRKARKAVASAEAAKDANKADTK